MGRRRDKASLVRQFYQDSGVGHSRVVWLGLGSCISATAGVLISDARPLAEAIRLRPPLCLASENGRDEGGDAIVPTGSAGGGLEGIIAGVH